MRSTPKFSTLVGKNIQMKRKKMGLNQAEFAEQIGIGQQSLSAMERGEIAPKFERLPIIAEQLCCPVADLFRLPSDMDNAEAALADFMAGLSADERQLIVRTVAGLALFFKAHKSENLPSDNEL